MLIRLKRFAAKTSRQPLTWKSIIYFLIVSWTIRYALFVIYCFLLHLLIFRWTNCPNEQYRPKTFSSLDAIPFIGTKYANEPSPCDEVIEENKNSNNIDLSIMSIVIFIPVHVTRFERRQTIRETWAKPFLDKNRLLFDDDDSNKKKLRTKLIFVVGSLPPPVVDVVDVDDKEEKIDRIENRLKAESTEHGDLLRLSDVIDDYYNITLKIRSVLNWARERCPSAAFIIRADSDIVLDYSNLLRFLYWLDVDNEKDEKDEKGDTSRGQLVAGYCRPNDCVTRFPGSKTCLPRSVYDIFKSIDYDGALFVPRYCFGFSYVLSRKFVARILAIWPGGGGGRGAESISKTNFETRNILNQYWPLDDVYVTGLMAEALGGDIPRLNHPHAFTYSTKFDAFACRDNGVVASAAYENDDEMKRRWTNRWRNCQ